MYEWFRGEAGDISTPVGSNQPSFTTPALTASTAHWLRITNAFGSVDTPTVFITVGRPPAIAAQPAAQPAAQAVLAGAIATFTVAADGTAPLIYQ